MTASQRENRVQVQGFDDLVANLAARSAAGQEKRGQELAAATERIGEVTEALEGQALATWTSHRR